MDFFEVAGGRAATVVGIPKISLYTNFFQNSVFLEAKGGALQNQKSVKLGMFEKISRKGAALAG